MELYKSFKRGVFWNTLEAVFIPGLLALNQLLLFRTLLPVQYGTAAVIFSLIYIALPIINLGFDPSIPAFIKKCIQNKQNFLHYLVSQLTLQSMIVVGLATILTLVYWLLGPYFFNMPTIPSSIMLIIGCTIVGESLKKTLRALAHALFLNKQTMIIELISVTIYFVLVWSYYIATGQLNVYTIFIPLLIQSVISNIALSITTFNFYKNLPVHSKSSRKLNILSRTIPLRAAIFTQQMSLIFFSRNFLIPLFSWIYGLATIGLFKLISELAIMVLVFVEKVLGTTGSALFAHIKHESLSQKRKAFTMLSNHLFSLLLSVLIFLVLNGKTIFCLYCGNIAYSYQALLFFFAIVFENMFIMYERFGIVEEKLSFIISLNFLSALICFPFIYFLQCSLPLAITLILTVRLCAFIVLNIIYYRFWKVPSNISLHWFFISCITMISLILRFTYSA